ncbi:hypothetical protein DOS86_02780 [Anaplasma marginale]|uniref:hypothetical protein n=1 Tax=Anaplasma marginale TaxID=770 RepID=UPI000DEEFD1A|nr:hypothetical protein [Anaplasma marginale]KAA8472033.1 hypothetical protein F0Q58_04715 [Anaplasma marginale]KAB0450368.1 hypothetical protein FY210_04750 [Anaplasma marginale]RCL19747.1 hypothetical protein DOS86_02780 [Anaplasma marginale]
MRTSERCPLRGSPQPPQTVRTCNPACPVAAAGGKAVSSFAEVERGFHNKFNVQSELLEQLQLKLAVHSTDPLADATKQYVERTLKTTLEVFHANFALEPHNTPQELNIYVFEHKREFDAALRSLGIHSNIGGIAWPSDNRIYVYKEGKNRVANLPHELSHLLFDYAISSRYGSHIGVDILNEGVGEYIQHSVEHGHGVDLDLMRRADRVLQMFKDDPRLSSTKNLDGIMAIIDEHTTQAEPEKQDYRYTTLKYDLGATLIHYLQTHNPHALRESFRNSATAPYNPHGEYTDQLASAMVTIDPFNLLMHLPTGFEKWLNENATEQFANRHNALFVRRHSLIGFEDKIIDGEVKQVKVFDAHLENSRGGIVTTLSPVGHIGVHDTICAINPYSGDALNIQYDYHFLKPVIVEGVRKYTYCNAQGEDYLLGKYYKNVSNISRIMTKYDRETAEIREAVVRAEKAYGQYVQAQDAHSEHALREAIEHASVMLDRGLNSIPDSIPHMDFVTIAGTEYENRGIKLDVRTKMLGAAYSEYVTKRAYALAAGYVNSAESLMISKALRHLVYIDPIRMRSADPSTLKELWQYPSGTVLSLEATGKGDVSGVSVFLPGGKKVAELPSDSEAFVVYEDMHSGFRNFITGDGLKSVYTTYSEAPVAVVTLDEHGNKVSQFVRGTVASDGESSVVVSLNKFLDPKILALSGDDKLTVSQGVKIEPAVDASEASSGTVARKGTAVDDRGTDRTSDDTYDATVYSNNEMIVQRLSRLQFYMREERRDENGDIIENPAFFIRDVAASRVLQFPDSITHLKLVRTENGTTRLVPCTKDGDTNPPGMPYNTKGYTYIDPIFAYQRIEADWIAKHAKLDLIDFTRYADGTLFKLRWNVDDPQLPRNAQGEIIRVHDQSYFARAELVYEPENVKIGELSSAPSFFQGDIFLAFDPNYSHSDFVSSLHEQEVELQNGGNGTQRVSLTGKGDLGTDSGFSDYYSFMQRQQGDSPELVQEIHRRAGIVEDASADQAAINAAQMSKVDASQHDLQQLRGAMLYLLASDRVVNGQKVHEHDFFIANINEGSYFQLPRAITHLKVVTHNGQKHLVPSTADGLENPKGMPQDLGEHRYISSVLVHENAVTDHTPRIPVTNVLLTDLNKYEDGTLLEIRDSGNISYAGIGATGDGYSETVHLFDKHGSEVGVLSKHPHLLVGKVALGIRGEPTGAVDHGVHGTAGTAESGVVNTRSAHDDALDDFLRARHDSIRADSSNVVKVQRTTRSQDDVEMESSMLSSSTFPHTDPHIANVGVRGGTPHRDHTDDALIDSVAWNTHCNGGTQCHTHEHNLLPL